MEDPRFMLELIGLGSAVIYFGVIGWMMTGPHTKRGLERYHARGEKVMANVRRHNEENARRRADQERQQDSSPPPPGPPPA